MGSNYEVLVSRKPLGSMEEVGHNNWSWITGALFLWVFHTLKLGSASIKEEGDISKPPALWGLIAHAYPSPTSHDVGWGHNVNPQSRQSTRWEHALLGLALCFWGHGFDKMREFWVYSRKKKAAWGQVQPWSLIWESLDILEEGILCTKYHFTSASLDINEWVKLSLPSLVCEFKSYWLPIVYHLYQNVL